METEPKAKARSHRRKRRERAKKLLPDPSDSDGELDGDSLSRLIESKNRSRSKLRKKKGTGTYEEDIIDGFAIVSFRSVEELEKFTQGKLVSSTRTKKNEDNKCNTRNQTLSPANRSKHLHCQENKNNKQTTNTLPKSKHNNSAADSESSGETTDNLDASDLIINGLKKSGTSGYSDVSSTSGSGAGYLCDSESGDERVSDASLDIFASKPVSNIIKCDPALPSTLPPVSTHSSTITTATSTTTVSDVFVTIVNSTASCVSLNNNNLSTASASVTWSYNNDRSHHNYRHHNHQQQQQQLYLNNNAISSIENKYLTHSNHQKKCLNETYTNSSHSVIKRRLPSPPQTKSFGSPSPKPKRTCSTLTLQQSFTASNSVISSDTTRPSSTRPSSTLSRSRTPRQELHERDYQGLPPNLSVSKSFFSPGYPSHASFPASLYSPLAQGPGLHPLHSTASQSATFPVHHSRHPSATQTQPQRNMFVPPMPLGLPGAIGSPTAPLATDSSLSNPDLLREELNHRFLASQERSPFLGSMAPLLWADIHQHMHQHQHQHQHMHQHTYHGGMAPLPSISTPSLVPATSNPFDKTPSNTFYRQGPIAGLPGYPAPIPDVLHSGLPGAFQPKSLAGLHCAVDPLYMAGREKPAAHLAMVPPTALPTTAKKPGKWCAVHVRIAWEIYHHQQKPAADKCSDAKTVDPLRPPNHVLSGGLVVRTPDQPSIALLGSSRVFYDSSPNSLQNCASHLAPPFSRPSPYSISSSLPIGLGNGLPSASHDLSLTVPSIAHERGHPHRTPPTFPSPWTKTEDREKEAEREREMNLERRREEDRERERRLLEHDRYRFSTHFDDSGPDREQHYREHDRLTKSRSRSRSRSPMRNGRVDSAKSDRSYERRIDENSVLKVKEERRESLTREEEIMAERDRFFKNDYLVQANSFRGSEALMQVNMERARMLTTPAGFLAPDRAHGHPSFWNPFDKSPLDFQNQRFNLQREMEAQFLNRYSASGLSQGFPVGLSSFEQDRYREEAMLREKRDYIERLPVFERERLYYENSKMAALRPDHVHASLAAHSFFSPAMHIKKTSPSVMPGPPPPLIHSGSASNSRGHSSPAVNKTKGVSPIDSVGESKRDSNSNSTDPDAHSR